MKGGETWILTGLVKATHYNGQSVTLIRADDSGARWLVRLDAAVWKSRELTVRAVNLKKSHPRLSLPDKVVLAMSRLMDVGLKRGFLGWKVALMDRQVLRSKGLQLIHRLSNRAAHKALASLRFNAKAKQQARARRAEKERQHKERDRLEETIADIAAQAAADGPSRRFVGRRHHHYFPGDHHGHREEGHNGGQFQNASASDIFRAPTAPTSRTPMAFEADATMNKRTHGRFADEDAFVVGPEGQPLRVGGGVVDERQRFLNSLQVGSARTHALSLTHTCSHARARARTHTHTHTHTRQVSDRVLARWKSRVFYPARIEGIQHATRGLRQQHAAFDYDLACTYALQFDDGRIAPAIPAADLKPLLPPPAPRANAAPDAYPCVNADDKVPRSAVQSRPQYPSRGPRDRLAGSPTSSSDGDGEVDGEEDEDVLVVGAVVRIRGLEGAKQLNGCKALVEGYESNAHGEPRIVVYIERDEQEQARRVKIARANLVLEDKVQAPTRAACIYV